MAIERTTVNASEVRNLHWSAVLAGGFTSVGVWLFLNALGAAIGGNRPSSAWVVIYTVLAPIIAFFVGGLVLARSRGIDDRFDAGLHGIVSWGFGLCVGLLVLSVLGADVLFHSRPGLYLPDGFMWAVTGGILGSLISCVLGAAAFLGNRVATPRGDVAVTTTRREVYP
jgi:hypothetical protein